MFLMRHFTRNARLNVVFVYADESDDVVIHGGNDLGGDEATYLRIFKPHGLGGNFISLISSTSFFFR